MWTRASECDPDTGSDNMSTHEVIERMPVASRQRFTLSCVVPVFNEEGLIDNFCRRCTMQLAPSLGISISSWSTTAAPMHRRRRFSGSFRYGADDLVWRAACGDQREDAADAWLTMHNNDRRVLSRPNGVDQSQRQSQ
jgi:hypothetical protein